MKPSLPMAFGVPFHDVDLFQRIIGIWLSLDSQKERAAFVQDARRFREALRSDVPRSVRPELQLVHGNRRGRRTARHRLTALTGGRR